MVAGVGNLNAEKTEIRTSRERNPVGLISFLYPLKKKITIKIMYAHNLKNQSLE